MLRNMRNIPYFQTIRFVGQSAEVIILSWPKQLMQSVSLPVASFVNHLMTYVALPASERNGALHLAQQHQAVIRQAVERLKYTVDPSTYSAIQTQLATIAHSKMPVAFRWRKQLYTASGLSLFVGLCIAMLNHYWAEEAKQKVPQSYQVGFVLFGMFMSTLLQSVYQWQLQQLQSQSDALLQMHQAIISEDDVARMMDKLFTYLRFPEMLSEDDLENFQQEIEDIINAKIQKGTQRYDTEIHDIENKIAELEETIQGQEKAYESKVAELQSALEQASQENKHEEMQLLNSQINTIQASYTESLDEHNTKMLLIQDKKSLLLTKRQKQIERNTQFQEKLFSLVNATSTIQLSLSQLTSQQLADNTDEFHGEAEQVSLASDELRSLGHGEEDASDDDGRLSLPFQRI